jgi:hypothetical protein
MMSSGGVEEGVIYVALSASGEGRRGQCMHGLRANKAASIRTSVAERKQHGTISKAICARARSTCGDDVLRSDAVAADSTDTTG